MVTTGTHTELIYTKHTKFGAVIVDPEWCIQFIRISCDNEVHDILRWSLSFPETNSRFNRFLKETRYSNYMVTRLAELTRNEGRRVDKVSSLYLPPFLTISMRTGRASWTKLETSSRVLLSPLEDFTEAAFSPWRDCTAISNCKLKCMEYLHCGQTTPFQKGIYQTHLCNLETLHCLTTSG